MMTRIVTVGLALGVAMSFCHAQTPQTSEKAHAPATGGIASSLKVFVYPAKNQEAPQQQKDEGECFAWSKQQTGIDPMAPPEPVVASTPGQKPSAPKGGAVKGAAGGAVAGTAIGAIAGNTGKGAAIGATAGALRGRRQQKMANKAAEQKAKEMEQQKQKEAAHAQKTAAEERMGTFRKAFSACMEARGYTVR